MTTDTYSRFRRVTVTTRPAVANCTRCDQPLAGRTVAVQGYLLGCRPPRQLAQYLCPPCAQQRGFLREDGTMTDDDVTALFDRLACRPHTTTHGLNPWGLSYLDARDAYRRRRPDDRAAILAADRAVVEALGDDPDVLFSFATSTMGHHFGRAVLFGEGPDAPAAFIAEYRKEYLR